MKDAGLASRAQLIQLTRAVLLVEGDHDQAVIEKFVGKELRRARTWILPLGGAKHASAIPEIRLLRNLDVPLFLLFDNVRAQSLLDGREHRSDSLEEREIKELFRNWPEHHPRPTILPYRAPDIICALPDSAVQEVIKHEHPKSTFGGWQPLIAEYRALPPRDRHDFKAFAGARTALHYDLRTIRRILAQSPAQLDPSSPLYMPLQQLLAHIG